MDDTHFRNRAGLIDEHTNDFEPPTIDGHKYCTGLAPRDYDKHPMFARGAEFPDELLLDDHDLKLAFEDQLANKWTLFDLREHAGGYLDSLDQDGLGLCWYFSSTKAYMYARKRAGLPDIKVSPWWGAGQINKWRDQGGWCEASAAHMVEHGLPRLELCPKYSREYDKPEVKTDATTRLLREFWETSQDKDKRNHQTLSAYARGFSCAEDYNHMGHSMAGCRIVGFEGLGRYDKDADNSWGSKAGADGLYRLKGSKARNDACVIFRVASATNA